MRWQPEEPSCAECGFDWHGAAEAAIELVMSSPSTLRVIDPTHWSRSPGPGVWSPAEYLWHLVDVLRIGSERLWTIARDPQTPLVCWDENALAQVRKYSQLSPLVGEIAFGDAVTTWIGAARTARLDVEVQHDALGAMTAADILRHNAHEVEHHRRDILRQIHSNR